MTDMFPTGSASLLSGNVGRAALGAAPIIVASMPTILGSNGPVLTPGPINCFSAQFAAVAAGASVTLIPASTNQKWFIYLFSIFLSATGIFAILDNAAQIGFFTATLNTLIQPFGPLPYGLSTISTNTPLILKNTSAAVCTYNVTLYGGYTA